MDDYVLLQRTVRLDLVNEARWAEFVESLSDELHLFDGGGWAPVSHALTVVGDSVIVSMIARRPVPDDAREPAAFHLARG